MSMRVCDGTAAAVNRWRSPPTPAASVAPEPNNETARRLLLGSLPGARALYVHVVQAIRSIQSGILLLLFIYIFFFFFFFMFPLLYFYSIFFSYYMYHCLCLGVGKQKIVDRK